MRIGLIDVDSHHFPNLTLMRISAYHKARGDTVEWWWSDMIHYDPYVMIYNKPSAPAEIIRLQRWVNNKVIFRATKTFEEYDGRR